MVPAGALISEGKLGNVFSSDPRTATVLANCVPVSCIPSPESPAKSTDTLVFDVTLTCLVVFLVSVIVPVNYFSKLVNSNKIPVTMNIMARKSLACYLVKCIIGG